MEQEKDIVKKEEIGTSYVISTIKMYSIFPGRNYETMIFKKTNGKINYSDIYRKRYETREEAEAGHEKSKVWLEEYRELEIQDLRNKVKDIKDMVENENI